MTLKFTIIFILGAKNIYFIYRYVGQYRVSNVIHFSYMVLKYKIYIGVNFVHPEEVAKLFDSFLICELLDVDPFSFQHNSVSIICEM